MKKILTVCIPTYKRAQSLRRCIQSVVMQIEKTGLSTQVSIYVANDASTDETIQVCDDFHYLSYFKDVHRASNFGMNKNIRYMLSEASTLSEYQLIITDDDYLQADSLRLIVEFLQKRMRDTNARSVFWTPRFSYLESGKLHCVVCNSFDANTDVTPSAFNAGRFMYNGFILSGLFVKSSHINFRFWDAVYGDNAFFPMIFTGELLVKNGGFYWNKNIVHHTVLNECHWEDWGRSNLLIEIRLLCDSLNSFAVVAENIRSLLVRLLFYVAAIPSIFNILRCFVASENLNSDAPSIKEGILEQKVSKQFNLKFSISIIVYFGVLLNIIVAIFKLLATLFLSVIAFKIETRKYYLERFLHYKNFIKKIPILFSLIL